MGRAVDMNHAGAQSSCHTLGAGWIAGLHVCRQPVAGIVGACDRLLFGLKRHDSQDRTKHFLPGNPHGVVDVGKNRRLDEIAGFEARRLAGTTDEEARALRDAGLDQCLHAAILDVADKRPDVATFLRRASYRGTAANALSGDSLRSFFARGAIEQRIRPLLALEQFTAG